MNANASGESLRGPQPRTGSSADIKSSDLVSFPEEDPREVLDRPAARKRWAGNPTQEVIKESDL